MGLPLYVAPVESDLSARAAAKARDTARSPIRRVRHRISETRENRRRTNWLDDIDRFVEFATQRPTSVPPPNTSSTSTARLASSNTSTSTSTPTPAPGSLPFPPPAVPAAAGNAQSTGSRQNSELSIVETGSPRDGNTRRILIVDATGLEAVLVDDTHYRYLRRMDDPASISGGWVHDGISERTLDLPRDPASQNRDDILANAEYILNNRGREAQRLISESQRLLDESESQLARVANTLTQSANSEHTRDIRPTGHMGQIPLRRPSRWSRRDRIQDSATLTVPGEASIRWTRVATPPYRTSAARGYLASRAVHRSRPRAYPSSSTPLALLRTQLSQVSQPSSPRRALRFDGLGDRERSLSPEGDGVWDTLLTTLTPDPQPPSVGSSFASTNASTTASQSAAVSSNTSLAAHEQGDSLEFGEQTSYEDSDPDGEFLGNGNEDEEEDDDPDEDEDTDETMVDLQREIDHARSYADVAAIDDGEDLDSLQHIMRSLAHREDIPDDWWLGAGLRRNLARRSS